MRTLMFNSYAAPRRCLAGVCVFAIGSAHLVSCAHDWEDLRFSPDGVAGAGAVGGTSTATGAGQGGGTTTGTGQGGGTSTGGSQGGAGSGGAMPCQWSGRGSECQDGYYCDAVDCGDGICRPLGTAESSAREPVCGCDSITYWNATIAAARGMSVAQPGECQFATGACGSQAGACQAGLFCNLERSSNSECSAPNPMGVCWAMPQQCPDPPPSSQYVACNASDCTGQCELIKLGVTYWHETDKCN